MEKLIKDNGFFGMDYRDLSGPSWGRSSVGRAPALQAGGQEFESPRLHHLVFDSESVIY